MLRLIVWIIIIYILAKIIGTILLYLRPFFRAPKEEEPAVKEKKNTRQFDNVQDADFEDITEDK